MEEGGTLNGGEMYKDTTILPRRGKLQRMPKLSKLQNIQNKTHHFLMQNFKKSLHNLTLLFFYTFLLLVNFNFV